MTSHALSRPRSLTQVRTGVAVLLGAIVLAWPALWNRYPLVTPDTVAYVDDGRTVASVFRHPWSHHLTEMRAEFYDLGIFLLHWSHWLWPVIVMNTLLTSLVIWLLVKHEVRARPVPTYLVMVSFLAVTTSLSWYASSVLTDVFGPLAYLALYLLIFHFPSMSRVERWLLAFATWWGIVAHTSHLLVCLALCATLILLSLCHWKPFATRRRMIFVATAIVIFGALSQVAFHRFLYGKATLNGNPPPYLMARAIADGPAVMYLNQNCSQLNWVICKHVGHFPDKEDKFLWEPGGVWDGASPAERDALRKEEKPLVLATLRTYPKEQLRRSWRNFRQQLTAIALYESAVRNPWLTAAIPRAMHGSGGQFLNSRQAQSSLPVAASSDLQDTVCAWSAVALAVLLPLAWFRNRRGKIPLAVVALTVLVANALVCGVISGVSMRYQGRVIWLLPLLVILLAMDLFELRPADAPSGTVAR